MLRKGLLYIEGETGSCTHICKDRNTDILVTNCGYTIKRGMLVECLYQSAIKL